MVSEEAQGQSFCIQKGDTYPLTIGVIESLQFYNVGMADNPHYLSLTVLSEPMSVILLRQQEQLSASDYLP